MKTKINYCIPRLLQWLAFWWIPALLIFSGCGQKGSKNTGQSDHGHAGDTAFANIPHSHEDPSETCFICDASKRDEGRLWCGEHARYEDRCWICHPELEDKSRLWCKEHSLYEDECFLCHPELGDAGRTSQAKASTEVAQLSEKRSSALFCNEHQVAEAECAICQPDLASALPMGGSMKIRFPSKQSAEKVGIQTEYPEMSTVTPTIGAFCESQYNLNKMARVTPLVSGVIRRVLHDVGDQILEGDALVELHSAEVAETKSAYLSAVVDEEIRKLALDRELRLKAQNISAEKELLEARAAFRRAQLASGNLRQRLINLGMNQDEIERVEKEQDTSAHLTIRAPFSGTLVARNAVRGEAVEVGDELFTLADLSTYWLDLSIPSDAVGHLQIGQAVEASFPELPGTAVTGSIDWVNTAVDPKTRMIKARAVVMPGNRRITAGLFGEAVIAVGKGEDGSIVPSGAIQKHAGHHFVFVRNEPDLFGLRRVALAKKANGRAEITAGLRPDDAVVTEGSFIVMSEFLKSRLGAGCVDH